MSSLIAFCRKGFFVIGTDTLAHTKKNGEIVPLNTVSKTLYLPQFKSCIAGQGLTIILNQLFVFLQEQVIAKDIRSAVTQIKDHFKPNSVSGLNQENLGTFFVFGLNNSEKELEVVKLSVSRTGEIKQELIPLELIVKPNFTGIEKIFESNQQESIDEIIFLLMKEQKRQDELKETNDQVGIGGQCQITTIRYSSEQEEFSMNVTIKEFDDYLDTYYDAISGNAG